MHVTCNALVPYTDQGGGGQRSKATNLIIQKKHALEMVAVSPAAWAAIGLLVKSPGAAGQPACTVISAGV